MTTILEINKDIQEELIEVSRNLKFRTQISLRLTEDEFAKKFAFNIFKCKLSKDILKYLALSSLPFSFKDCDVNINSLWKLKCRKCKSVIYRKTMPTGNLRPKILVVGDAPGVGDGELFGKFDRAWVYGPSSHLLRKALLAIGEYFGCWFTNLLKCSTPRNRPSLDNEVSACISQLKKEVSLLQPKKIILLGKHVQDMCPDLGIPIINLYHPTYFIRKGINYKEYAKIIKEKLK